VSDLIQGKGAAFDALLKAQHDHLKKGITSMLATLGKDKGNAAAVEEKKAVLDAALAMKDPAAQCASLMMLNGELMVLSQTGIFDSVHLKKSITSTLETLGKDAGSAAAVKEKKAALDAALAMKDPAAQCASLMKLNGELNGELTVLSQTGIFDPANAHKVQANREKVGLRNDEMIHAQVRLMPSSISTTNIPDMCDWLMENSVRFAETYTTQRSGRKRLRSIFGTDEEKDVIARIKKNSKDDQAAKRARLASSTAP
jgi:hypothetical protein